MSRLQIAASKLASKRSDESVAMILSDILVMSMTVIYNCYCQLRKGLLIDSGRQAQIDMLRGRARSLLVMVGLMQGVVRSEASAEMARMEVTMV
jgi:hypothetical protein